MRKNTPALKISLLLLILWMSTMAIAASSPQQVPHQKEGTSVENTLPFDTETPYFHDRKAPLAFPALPSYSQHSPESRTPVFMAFAAVMSHPFILTAAPVLLFRSLFALHYHGIILYPFHAFW